ncbi:hypothetical protein Tco_1042929 [Tanacetum coccineum]|uniref:Uncharacterized protein n=1 Tax=Tanacetum coccineum TaxID=301880 RepID=A0ABQ5GLZ3_9ASTR
MGSHTQQQLKRLSFDELKALFETTMTRVQTFHPIESEGDKIVPKLTTGSSKRVAELELDHEGSKKQKTNEASGSVQEQPKEEETELSQEDLQQMMMVVPVEEVYVEAIQVKYPIIDWEIYSEDTRRYWRIIRKLQRYIHDPLTWRLYDTCGVHHVSTDKGHDIFMLVEKDYPLTRGLLTLMLCNKLQVDRYSEMADELLRKIVNHKFRGGLLGIKGFYKFLLLVQLSTAKRRLSTAKLNLFKRDQQKWICKCSLGDCEMDEEKVAGTQKESQICCGQFISKLARKCRMLTEDVVRRLSAPIYCRDLDTTTLRDLIGSDGKLIPEDPQPGVPRVGIPRPPRASMQDLYDRMGHVEIHQDVIERMKYRQSYHWDRYHGVFEHMARVYSVLLQGAYNPPGYANP